MLLIFGLLSLFEESSCNKSSAMRSMVHCSPQISVWAIKLISIAKSAGEVFIFGLKSPLSPLVERQVAEQVQIYRITFRFSCQSKGLIMPSLSAACQESPLYSCLLPFVKRLLQLDGVSNPSLKGVALVIKTLVQSAAPVYLCSFSLFRKLIGGLLLLIKEGELRG